MQGNSNIRKVVIIGPESTGKSTLSAALADELQTVWVPEYARAYIDTLDRRYEEPDLLTIARGQITSEDELLPKANRWLLCDTDLYVIKVWSEHRYGHCNAWILEEIASRPYCLYLLTYPDMAWEDDPQREYPDPAMRHYFYAVFRDIMQNTGIPWVDIRGTHEQRQQLALQAINSMA